jgi:hypothetical protein
MNRGVEADGIESVAHLIVSGAWFLLAAVFGFSGTSIFAFWGSAGRFPVYICSAVSALTFLIGVLRLLIAIRSKARFHLTVL